MAHDEAVREEPPTLSWAIKYALQDGHRHSFSDPAGARVWDGIFERVDAAEALALATEARVEAEARNTMAFRLTQAARPQHGPRWTRAAMGNSVASIRAADAHQAECAALAWWREVAG